MSCLTSATAAARPLRWGNPSPAWLAVSLTTCVLVSCAPGPAPVPAVTSVPTVVEVLDGDTVVIRVGDLDHSVRLIGVDTPETKHPSKPVECFGAEASAFTGALLPAGTVVRLERDVEERDAYGRLLAYLYREDDGLFVNLELARGGFADELPIEPNAARRAEISAAVDRARQADRGLWGACGGPGVPVI